ncbi:MAG: tetratricopeptide repeat protein [Candidatus Stygibacter frigidus]|nr:tetratricopeptide repeat protein [Candidatus Stygibacter frigidus]
MKKDSEKIIIKETIRREFGRYDDEESNDLILTFLVIDKIISRLIDQNIQPSVAIHYFDQWINLYISGDYELEYSEDSCEVTCSFIVNSITEPDKHLLESIGMIPDTLFNRMNINSSLSQIEEINQAGNDMNPDDSQRYQNLIKELINLIELCNLVSLYLNERFSDCQKALFLHDFEFNITEPLFLFFLIDINVCLISGEAGEVPDYFDDLSDSDWDQEELDSLKGFIYWTAGMYLEGKPQGIKKILNDDTFPESEKFWFLHSMSICPYIEDNPTKRHHYLNLAENYAGKKIHHLMQLIEDYNILGFWKDSLRLIHKREYEYGDDQLMNIPKARTLMDADKHQEALVILEKEMAKLEEENVDMMAMMGDCLIAVGKSKEGIAYLERVLEIEPDYLDALLILGLHNFVEKKNYRMALRYLLAAEKQNIPFPEIYNILADIYEDLGLMKKSEEYRNKSLPN